MRASATLIALAVSFSTTATAQELIKPEGRQGYYLGGGLRQTVMTATADDVGSLGLLLGFGGAIRAGQMTNDWFGLGLLVSFNGGGNSDWGGGGGALQVEAQLVPLEDEDLAIRAAIGFGGVGVARVDAAQETDDDPSGTAGAVYTLGVSYDLFPFIEPEKYESGGFAFTGFLEATLLPGGNLTTGGIMIGLEITYWFGFQKSRLDIPADVAFEK